MKAKWLVYFFLINFSDMLPWKEGKGLSAHKTLSNVPFYSLGKKSEEVITIWYFFCPGKAPPCGVIATSENAMLWSHSEKHLWQLGSLSASQHPWLVRLFPFSGQPHYHLQSGFTHWYLAHKDSATLRQGEFAVGVTLRDIFLETSLTGCRHCSNENDVSWKFSETKVIHSKALFWICSPLSILCLGGQRGCDATCYFNKEAKGGARGEMIWHSALVGKAQSWAPSL